MSVFLFVYQEEKKKKTITVLIRIDATWQSHPATNISRFNVHFLHPSTHMYLSFNDFDTYSKLPGTKPPFKDSEVVDEQAATEGIFYVQTNQPAPQEPPHLQMGHHKFSF